MNLRLNIAFVFIMILTGVSSVHAEEFKTLKGDHFVIQYEGSTKDARYILRRAERYYDSIARNLGYERYDESWSWERRCEIFLYQDQESYQKGTGATNWSGGHANLRDRKIYTFTGQAGFEEETLPHEVTHLIFKDFVGLQFNIALWLHEGLALLEEEGRKKTQLLVVAKKGFSSQTFIPLKELTSIRDLSGVDTETALMYYAESLVIVSYLKDKYKTEKFIQFCRDLRDGLTLEESLRRLSSDKIETLDDLEEKLVSKYSLN